MPLTTHDLVESFGSAVSARNAALFVGAGLSRTAGYPDWDELLSEPRAEAAIPKTLTDLPLVSQYYVNGVAGGRERLEQHILAELTKVPPSPTEGHAYVASLLIDELWTTNYDVLLEMAIPAAQVVATDKDLVERRQAWARRVIKMHGSLSVSLPAKWLSPPVITREDYEKYEERHPRIWAALTATFLTKSFLFLGFSFSDPNLEILFRLARTRLNMGGPEHYTVLRRPTDPVDLLLHEHRVRDLEHSGVGVFEISEYAELTPLLAMLTRRTRRPQLFVSGSQQSGVEIAPLCKAIGSRLAEVDSSIEVGSLAGEAGMDVSYAFGKMLRSMDQYDASRIRFHFRPKDDPPPALKERIGTVVYEGLPVESLRRRVIDESRALLVLGGGSTTQLEIDFARERNIPVIPVPTSEGCARKTWNELMSDIGKLEYGGRPVNPKDLRLLDDSDINIVASAAVRIIQQAMYLGA